MKYYIIKYINKTDKLLIAQEGIEIFLLAVHRMRFAPLNRTKELKFLTLNFLSLSFSLLAPEGIEIFFVKSGTQILCFTAQKELNLIFVDVVSSNVCLMAPRELEIFS